MAIKTIKYKNITWHHIDEVNKDALDFLKSNYRFHPLDLGDVAAEIGESKIDIYKNYFFLILCFPILNRASGRIDLMEMDIFCGPDYLVTVQKGKYKAMRDLYYRLQNNTKNRQSFFGENSGYLLYRVLDVLYRDAKFINSYIARKARELEDEVYNEDSNKETAREIAYLRKKILSLKRIYAPQDEVATALTKLKVSFLPEDLNNYFDDIDDQIDKVLNFLENQKSAMKDLLEVYDSLMNHATNKVIKILTVISVGMLPLTLLSGIYGMNIDLPWANSPSLVLGMFVFLLLFILLVMYIFKRKKLL
ncbi:magnesium transporter CorA family protein [Candidatus Kuenenbacteria bacterium]|nr:magnesium transporter CorA family protein [Candidatus Kuenenbacteria bacterium]